MNIQDKIASIIQNRPCFVLAKGQSLLNLEKKIEHFRDKNICWVSMNDFEYLERGILGQIQERFDMISDCATAGNATDYEETTRIPWFLRYLNRPDNNLLMISDLVIEECFKAHNRADILHQYPDKIITIDSLFSLPTCDKDVWLPPPNSITLLFAFLIAGGAKNIVVFGLDGCAAREHSLDSYYQSDHVKEERLKAFGNLRPGSLREDGIDFNNRFAKIFQLYKQGFNNPDVKIYNCNPDSFITALPIITFTQALELI